MLLECFIERHFNVGETVDNGSVFLDDFSNELSELVTIIGIGENSKDFGQVVDSEGNWLVGSHDVTEVVTEMLVYDAVEM